MVKVFVKHLKCYRGDMSWSEESTDGTKTGSFRRIIDHPRYNNKCGIDSGTIQKLQLIKECCVDQFQHSKDSQVFESV